MNEFRSENEAVIEVMKDLAKVQGLPGLPEGHVAFAVPNGFEVKDFTAAIDKRFEERGAGPRRIIGTEVAETLEAFEELVKRHAGAETAIFAQGGARPRLEAVIDYHGATSGTGPTPAWQGQRVAYAFPYTKDFAAWLSAGVMPKREFLAFVQDRVRDIADPSEVDAPAGTITREVFEAVLRAQGKSKADRAAAPLETLFGSPSALVDGAKRLAAISTQKCEETDHGLGGVEIRYEKADKVEGSERVREFYLVEVEAFHGSGKTVIPARLKVRVENGSLYLCLELLGVEQLIEKAFTEAIDRVWKSTGRPVYRATLAK